MRPYVACTLGLLLVAGCASTAPGRPAAAAPGVSTAHPRGSLPTAAATGPAESAATRPVAAPASGGVRATLVIPAGLNRRDSTGASVTDARLTCAEFDTPLGAQVALAAGHYHLDPDGDGVACEQAEEAGERRR